MSIQVVSNSIDETKVETPVVEAKDETNSAPVAEEPQEQKEASESETEETEAKDESEVESEESDEAKESKESKPKKSGYQRRVDKLNSKIAAAKQEAEYWRQEALKREEKPTEEKKVEAKVEASGKPKAEDFETHSEYIEALTDWKTDQKLKERDQKAEQLSLEEKQAKARQAHFDREKAFAEKTEDYAEVITEFFDSKPKVSAAFEDLVLSSENGPEILYTLAKDAKEFERLNSLPPLAAAREFGKLELKLASKASAPKQETKKITKAPEPIAPVGAKGGTIRKTLEDVASNGSQREYERMRREQMKQKEAS